MFICVYIGVFQRERESERESERARESEIERARARARKRERERESKVTRAIGVERMKDRGERGGGGK